MADASTRIEPGFAGTLGIPEIWVLEDPDPDVANPALGIAERLCLPFRRIPLARNWQAALMGWVPLGMGLDILSAAMFPRSTFEQPFRPPQLVIGAGPRAGAAAVWLKRRYGVQTVLFHRPGFGAQHCDLLIAGWHDRPQVGPNVIGVLGEPHRLSPLTLQTAAHVWRPRFAYLPRPLIALLVGGAQFALEMPPALAHGLAVQVAGLARRYGGAVLAATSRRTGAEATEALAAGLGSVMHVLHRWGDPTDSPYEAFIALADAIVVTADARRALSEACAAAAPVFVALPGLAGLRQRRFVASFYAAGHARPLQHSLRPWPRPPLDETLRVSLEIRSRFFAELPVGE
jgi:mitochondrial fission protein ELM1